MSQSYNFNRDTTNNFRGKSIDPAGFFAWQKDSMYKSSYAKFHSSVKTYFIILELCLTQKHSYSWLWRIYSKC